MEISTWLGGGSARARAANQDSFVSPEELEAVMSERQSRRMERFRQRREERGAQPAPPPASE